MIYNNAGISGLTGPDSHESPDILQRLDMYRGYPSEKLGPIASNGDLAAVSVLADRKDQERRQKENAAKNPTTTAIEDLLARNNLPVGSNSLPQMPQARPGMQGADTAMPNMGSPPGAGMIGAPSSPGMGLASQGPPTGSQMPPAGFNPQGGQVQPPVMGAKDGGLVDTFRRSGVRGLRSGKLTPENRSRILQGVPSLAETIRRNSQAVPGGNLYGPRDPFEPGGANYPERRHPVPSEQYKGRMTKDEVRAAEKGSIDDVIGMIDNDEELTALIKSMAGMSGMSDEELVERTNNNMGYDELVAEGVYRDDAIDDGTWPEYEEFQAPVDADYGPGGRNIERGMQWLADAYSEIPKAEQGNVNVPNIGGMFANILAPGSSAPVTSEVSVEGFKEGVKEGASYLGEVGSKILKAPYAFTTGQMDQVLPEYISNLEFISPEVRDYVQNNIMSDEDLKSFWSNEFDKKFGTNNPSSVASTPAPAPAPVTSGPVAATDEVVPTTEDPLTWSPVGGWLGAKTTGDRPPLAGAGRLDVTAMDKFMDKIEEMQRGRRGMSLIAMAAEMGKRHKGGFLPSAVAGMNAAGQSARGTDKLAMEGYGLAATLEQRGQDAELNYQGRLAQARRSAANRASDNEDRKNARKQATFDDQWIALLKNENSHMLESIMRPIYESEFGKTEAAVQALESLKARFYGGSLGINKGEITVSDQIEARGVVMRALAEQIRSQQMFAGDSGGGDQRYVPLNDFLQRRDV